MKCDQCEREFTTWSNVVRHKKLVHNMFKESTLKCSAGDCDFTTWSHKQMKKHVTVTHAETEKTFHCKKCAYACLSSSGLRHHMVSIHGVACRVCHKLFSTANRVDIHMRKEHVHVYPQSSDDTMDQIVVSRKIGEHARIVVTENNNGEKTVEDMVE